MRQSRLYQCDARCKSGTAEHLGTELEHVRGAVHGVQRDIGIGEGKAPRDIAGAATEVEHAAADKPARKATLELCDELAVRLLEIRCRVGACLDGIVHQFGFGGALHPVPNRSRPEAAPTGDT